MYNELNTIDTETTKLVHSVLVDMVLPAFGAYYVSDAMIKKNRVVGTIFVIGLAVFLFSFKG